MADQGRASYKTPFLIVGGLILLWGILGLLDLRNVPYAGFQLGPDNSVTRVYPGSPAEQAGMMVGDAVQSTGGIAIEDSRALSRRPRAEIGESRTIVVVRDGQTVNLDLSFSNQPGRNVALSVAGTLIGACFVVFGLLAYGTAQNRSTTLLALLGLAFGLTIGGPYIASFGLRTAVGFVVLAGIVLGFAFLLHFMLEFPTRKQWLAKASATKILYAPAVLIALLFFYLLVFQPAGTGGLNRIVNVLVGLFVVGYFGFSVIAVVGTYRKATPEERTAAGLNFMLVGIVLGLLPLIISSIVNVIAPSVVLPAVDFYFLTLVLIPIALAMAAMKQAKAPAAA